MHNPAVRGTEKLGLVCPYCGSYNLRWRRKSPSYGCRRCGTRFDLEGERHSGVVFQADKLAKGA